MQYILSDGLPLCVRRVASVPVSSTPIMRE